MRCCAEKEQNSLTIVARVPAGQNSHEVAAAGDGMIAYISNYSGNTISRVDLTAQKALPPVPVTRKVEWVMGTGQNRTHRVIASKDFKTVLTSNISSSTISVIEDQGRDWANAGDHTISIIDTPQKWLPRCKPIETIQMSPDGANAYTTMNDRNSVAVIDLKTLTITGDSGQLQGGAFRPRRRAFARRR